MGYMRLSLHYPILALVRREKGSQAVPKAPLFYPLRPKRRCNKSRTLLNLILCFGLGCVNVFICFDLEDWIR